jgi:hypothetical protein
VASSVPRRKRVASRLPEQPVSARLEANTVGIAPRAETPRFRPIRVKDASATRRQRFPPFRVSKTAFGCIPAPGWLVHRSQPWRAEAKEREVPIAPTHGPPTRCQVRPRSVVRMSGPISTSPGRERTANPTSRAPKDGSTRFCALSCQVRPPSWLCSRRVGHGEGRLVPQAVRGSMAAQASRVPRTTVIDRTAAPRHLVVQLRPPSDVTAIAPLQKYVRPEQVPQWASAATPCRAFQKEIEVGTGTCRAVARAAPPVAVTSSSTREVPRRMRTSQSMRMQQCGPGRRKRPGVRLAARPATACALDSRRG